MDTKRQIAHAVSQIARDKKDENQKEMRKMKEILQQEFEFKLMQLEEAYKKKENELSSTLAETNQHTISEVLLEIKMKNDQQKATTEQDRIKSHAYATQELYDDIHRTLKEKFKSEQKQKLAEVTEKLHQNLEEKVKQIQNQHEKELAKERKKAAKIELINAQQENEMFEKRKQIAQMEKELDKNKTIEQTLSNLKPINGQDGNCKRCESLYIINGQYVEKIQKLKRKVEMSKK